MLHFWKLYPNFAFKKPTILSFIQDEKIRMHVIIVLFAHPRGKWLWEAGTGDASRRRFHRHRAASV
jgi:hypothetical protein